MPLIDHPDMDKYFNVLLAIGNQPVDLESAMKFTASNLIRTARATGNLISLLRAEGK